MFRLLTGGLLVRIQPEEPIVSRSCGRHLSSFLHVALFRSHFMRVFWGGEKSPGCSRVVDHLLRLPSRNSFTLNMIFARRKSARRFHLAPRRNEPRRVTCRCIIRTRPFGGRFWNERRSNQTAHVIFADHRYHQQRSFIAPSESHFRESVERHRSILVHPIAPPTNPGRFTRRRARSASGGFSVDIKTFLI